MSDAVWLYAVVPAGTRTPGPPAPTGVADEPVRLVAEGPLAAAVGSVPLGDFAEQPLKEHLEDLRWLEAAARAHHQVIDALSAATEAVPLQFATVYRDDAAVRAVLRERAADFTAAFERTRDRTEWGVKAYMDPEASPEQPADGADDTSRTSPGTAYLLRRRAQRDSKEEAYRRASERAELIRADLGGHAAATAAHPPQDPRLAGYDGWMILNDSYLVDRSAAGAFAEAVAACGRRFPEVRVELSGPWPPYSFVGPGRNDSRGEREDGSLDGTGEHAEERS